MRKSLLLSAFLGLIIFASCKKDLALDSKDGLTIIPETAGMLVSLDIPTLMEKADFEYVKTLDFYKDMLKEATAENANLGAILEDPSKSGIDVGQKAYLAVNFDQEIEENLFTGVVLSLADPALFQNILEESEEGLEIQSGSGFKFATGDQKSIAAWNDQFAIIGGTDSYMNLESEVAKFFNTTPETSVAQNEDLQSVLTENHDITVWMSSNPFADNESAKFALSMAEIDPESLKDNFIHGYTDFKAGEVISKMEMFLQKGLTKDLDKFFDDKVDTDFSAYVPKENLLFAFSTAIDIQGIDEVLSARPQSKGMLEYSFQQYGITFADIVNTFSGDLFVMGVAPEGTGQPSGLFGMDIKDMDKLNEFLAMAVEMDAITADGNNIYKLSPGMGSNNQFDEFDFDVTFPDGSPRMILTDDKLFITGSSDLLAIVQNEGFARADRADGEVTRLLGEHIFGGYFALKAMEAYDSNMEKTYFDKMDVKVDRKVSEFHLEMDDKSQNSLRQLFEIANESYLNGNKEAWSEPEEL